MSTTTTTPKATTTRTRRPRAANPKADQSAPAAVRDLDASSVELDAQQAQEAAEEASATTAPDHAALAAKPPSELHERMAAWMTQQSGVQITPKQAQVVTALREAFRTSDLGQELVLARKAQADKRKAEELKAKKAAAREKLAKLQAILDA